MGRDDNLALPTGRKFGLITKKVAKYSTEQPDKSSAILGPDFPGQGQKGPNFATVFGPLFFSNECIENFDAKIIEKIDPILISKNVIFRRKANLFLSAAELFGQTILKMLGNIAAVRIQ